MDFCSVLYRQTDGQTDRQRPEGRADRPTDIVATYLYDYERALKSVLEIVFSLNLYKQSAQIEKRQIHLYIDIITNLNLRYLILKPYLDFQSIFQ